MSAYARWKEQAVANASLNTRLFALEQRSEVRGACVVVGPYAEATADRAAEEALAIARWQERHGRPVPPNARILHIVLRGVKPGEVCQ